MFLENRLVFVGVCVPHGQSNFRMGTIGKYDIADFLIAVLDRHGSRSFQDRSADVWPKQSLVD